MTQPRLSAARGSWVGAARRLMSDSIVRGSLYLSLTTATVAAAGFVFWLLNSRLYSAGQVGAATTLISGASLISYVSLLGFNTAFIRFLPASVERDAEIDTGLVMVFGTAVVVAALYVLLIPSFAPRLAFVRGSVGYAVGFTLLTALWSVNLVTDSIFVAFQKAQYNLFVDGLVQGVVKLALPALLVGLGAFGIFVSSGVGAAAAVAATLVCLMATTGYRPRLTVSLDVLRRTWDYSAANYAANLLSLCPVLVIPIIILDVRGPRQAAFYFIAFQVAGLLFSIAYAVSLSFFAECSQEGAQMAPLLRHSARLLVAVCVPCSLVVAVSGHWLLLLFGHAYSAGGAWALAVLALSTPSVALCSLATAVLRVTRRLRALVIADVVYAVVMVGLALVGARHGLPWVAVAFLVGNTAAGLTAAALAVTRPR